MSRKGLTERLRVDDVHEEIIRAGFLGYDYLKDPKRCPNGTAYSWEIADAVFNQPVMGGSTTREKMQTALSLFVKHNVLKQNEANLKYSIRNPPSD